MCAQKISQFEEQGTKIIIFHVPRAKHSAAFTKKKSWKKEKFNRNFNEIK